MDRFDEIRPYRDDEVASVLHRLLRDPELLDVVARMRLPGVRRVLPTVSRKLVQVALRRQLSPVRSVAQFQRVVKSYLDGVIARTSRGVSVSGLEGLLDGGACLFFSNHRDIALDPALVSHAMYQVGREPVRIAIGDNLLSRPFAADLMRVNKSFIVKRGVKGRQLLAATKTLSAYIRHSLLEENESVWIAHREGRAKDGVDKTDVAVVKMLFLARDRKAESFSEYLSRLRIVPVAISYEWDPCDVPKARELHAREETGAYHKGETEDLENIGRGIAGFKGAIHLHFGTPVTGCETPEAVAAEVDHQIHCAYVLYPSNVAAYRMLFGDVPDVGVGPREEPATEAMLSAAAAELERRCADLDPPVRTWLLRMYANPVITRLDAMAEPPAATACSV